MTVANNQSKYTYDGNGTTGPWNFPRYFIQDADLQVIKTSAAGVDSSPLNNPADYSVTGAGSPSGGFVTTTAVVAVGEKITVSGNVDYVQGDSYPETGLLPAKTVERGLDRLTMMVQQVKEITNRCLRLPISSLITNFSIAAPAANCALIYNATADGVINGPDASQIAAAATAATTATAAAAAAAASAAAAAPNANFNASSTTGTNGYTINTGNTSLQAWHKYSVKFTLAQTNTNITLTDTSTGAGAKNVRYYGVGGILQAPPVGTITVGFVGFLLYDGTNFILLNPMPNLKGQDVAAAATTDFTQQHGDFVNLTGTTGITAMTMQSGQQMSVYYTGAGLNITLGASLAFGNVVSGTLALATGDVLVIRRDGTVSRIINYFPANGGNYNVLNGQMAGFRNVIINGSMDIWQRGTAGQTLTTTMAYGGPDRWAAVMPTSAAGTVGQNVSVPTGVGAIFCARVGRTAASALTNAIVFAQALETANSIPLQGRTVNLSFYAKAGANYSAAASALTVLLRTGTGTDESASNGWQGAWTGAAAPINTSVTLTTSWQRFTVAVNAALAATLASNITQLMVDFRYTPTGTAGADDNFYIWGVQLEPGSVATPFERRSWGTELLLCQRYFQTLSNLAACAISAVAINIYGMFQVAMRAVPTITQTGVINTQGVAGVTQSATGLGTNFSTNYSLYLSGVPNFAGLTAGHSMLAVCPANNTNYLTASAEI